jgi:hypothetical protein
MRGETTIDPTHKLLVITTKGWILQTSSLPTLQMTLQQQIYGNHSSNIGMWERYLFRSKEIDLEGDLAFS